MENTKLTVDSVKNFEAEVDYTTVLDNFEGPLDLLLYLINKEKIEIQDIFVSQVTEQFLSYMKGLPYLDMDKASEYLNIASTIINIKSRSLLPVLDEEFEEYYEDDEDPKRTLITALEEYRDKILQEETPKLKERETIGYFFKEPEKMFEEVQVQYKDLHLEGLVKALTDMLNRQESRRRAMPQAREIPKDTYTVREKIQHIREKVAEREETPFEALFDADVTTPEIVTTFQALLELLKNQFVTVEQQDLFAQIIIKKNPNRSEEEDIGEIDEYH